MELWDAVKAGDHSRALTLHEQLLRLWNAMFGDNLPACTKYAQSLQGVHGFSRAPMPEPTDFQKASIRDALQGLGLQLESATSRLF